MLQYQIKIFKDLTNTQELIDYLKEKSNYELLKQNEALITVVDLNLVCSLFHLHVACHNAIQKYYSKTMKTKVFYEEVLHCLSGTNKISESTSLYSASPITKSVALIYFTNETDPNDNNSIKTHELVQKLVQIIHGQEIEPPKEFFNTPISNEQQQSIIKSFKLSPIEIQNIGLENCIITRIATKDIVN